MLTARKIDYADVMMSEPHLKIVPKQTADKAEENLCAVHDGIVWDGHEAEGDLYKVSNGKSYLVYVEQKVNPLSHEPIDKTRASVYIEEVINAKRSQSGYRLQDLELKQIAPEELSESLKAALTAVIRKNNPKTVHPQIQLVFE